MVRIRIKRVKKWEKINARGIHLFPPITDEQKLMALERAESAGFKTIYIHQKKKLKKVV
jgi:hypothetical protein